jgi:hypothetical protein
MEQKKKKKKSGHPHIVILHKKLDMRNAGALKHVKQIKL